MIRSLIQRRSRGAVCLLLLLLAAMAVSIAWQVQPVHALMAKFACHSYVPVYVEPGDYYLGSLEEGDPFNAGRSADGYTYGWASGSVQAYGWVQSNQLCDRW